MKTLLSFSGGIDSTYVLWKLLHDTDDQVTAAYLDVSEIEKELFTDRSPLKLEMVQQIVDKLKSEVRDFDFIVHKVKEEDVIPELKHNSLIFISYAAPMVNDGTYDRMANGCSYEDKHQRIVPHLEFTPAYYAEQRLFDQLCTRGSLWRPLIDHEWHYKYNRLCAILNLPKSIMRETHSCDSIRKAHTVEGIQYKKCNKCHKCLVNRKYIELYKQGMTLEQITDWREERSYHYGHEGLMAFYKNWIGIEMGLKPYDAEARLKLESKHFILTGIPNTGVWKGLIEP